MQHALVLLLSLGLAACDTTKSDSPAASAAPDAQTDADTGDAPPDVECTEGEIVQEDECVPCNPGTHSPGGNADICDACEPGETDLDQDPATACEPCTEPGDDAYVVGLCTPIRDTQFTDCTLPAEGQRVTERCDGGGPIELGNDTEVGACSEPEDGQFVIVPCDAGDPNDRGSDTAFDDCTAPGDGEFIETPCAPGAYNVEGSDAVMAACSEPTDGEYVVSICVDGVDTVIEACGVAADDEYTTDACVAGDSATAGTDTVVLACTTPGDGEYIATACTADADATIADCTAPGDGEFIDTACTADSDALIASCATAGAEEYVAAPCTADADSIIETCSTPGPEEFIDIPCTSDADATIATCSIPEPDEFIDIACTADADATIIACATPSDGEYVTTACTAATDTAIGDCSEPDSAAGTYAFAACVPGTAAAPGSDTDIRSCTVAGSTDLPAAAECETGSSASAGSDRVPGGAIDICLDAATVPDAVPAETDSFHAVSTAGDWTEALVAEDGALYCGTVDGLAAGTVEFSFAATPDDAGTGFAYESDVVFTESIEANVFTDSCNGWDSAGCDDDTGTPPSTEAVDYCHLQWPNTVTGADGDTFDAYIWVYESGVTGDTGSGSGLVVDLGIGDPGETPSDDWTWSSCSFSEHKAGLDPTVLDNDEYACVGTFPSPGSYIYAGRVSVDGGPWLYCDLGAEFGSGSDDGYSPETAGTMTVP